MGLDDLIMSNHCILVPGDLSKALPWPAQQEQGCHLLCPDFSSVVGMSTLQPSLSGPVPLALYPQTSIKRTCEPGHLSCNELCVPPEQLCDFQQHCAEGEDEEKCGEASQSLPGLVLHGYGHRQAREGFAAFQSRRLLLQAPRTLSLPLLGAGRTSV